MERKKWYPLKSHHACAPVWPPCDMDPILKDAHRHSLYIVEDCAQAHGATYKGKKVGTFGDAAGFSYRRSRDLADKIRALGNYGSDYKHHHIYKSHNSRLDVKGMQDEKIPYEKI